MFARIALLLLLEMGVCLAQTAQAPMHYEVTVISFTAQSVVTESRGACVASSSIWAYLVIIIAVQGSFLLYGNYLVYALRSVPSEFNEVRRLHDGYTTVTRRPHDGKTMVTPRRHHGDTTVTRRLHGDCTTAKRTVTRRSRPSGGFGPQGKYIGFALANNMQTTLIALLLLFMTSDNPTLFFVMRWIAVFVVAVLT